MAWLQLHLATTEQHADAFQSALENLGAVAVTLTDGADQPVFEPPPGTRPLWQNTVVSALFEQKHTPEQILNALAAQGLEAQASHHETLEDQAWERAWMDDFSPMQFGERLWIIPSWSEAPDPAAVNLKLDPGLAFGTGTHETTALCLQWLDGTDLHNKTVLDFGCGSGVLAIAALLLGADDTTGTDIDPQALIASHDNAHNNGVAESLTLFLPEQMPLDYQCDVLVANILAGPLVELCELLAGYCRPGGKLALSGILSEQADSVRTAYEPWFELNPITQQGDWVRIDGIRRTV